MEFREVQTLPLAARARRSRCVDLILREHDGDVVLALARIAMSVSMAPVPRLAAQGRDVSNPLSATMSEPVGAEQHAVAVQRPKLLDLDNRLGPLAPERRSGYGEGPVRVFDGGGLIRVARCRSIV
jgi:hypothetical protein